MPDAKELKNLRGRYGLAGSHGHRDAVEHAKRTVLMSLENSLQEIGEFVIDKVFKGESSKSLSKIRRSRSPLSSAGRPARIFSRLSGVSRFRRLKRP